MAGTKEEKEIRKRLQDKYGRMLVDPAVGITFLSVGDPTTDEFLGGGLPWGRLVELYGKEGCGKTTFALFLVARALKAGFRAAWIDLERAFTGDYAHKMGVDLENERFLLAQPVTIEDAFSIANSWIQSTARTVIVMDSLAAGRPKWDVEENLKKSEVGRTAPGVMSRAASQCIKDITPALSMFGATMIIVNQTRTNLEGFRATETTPGGNALKFYASTRLRLRRVETVTKKVKGIPKKLMKVELRVYKNKLFFDSIGEVMNLWVIPGMTVRAAVPRKQIT